MKVLSLIYGIPYGLSFRQSQRKLFSMAGWVPFHLLHKKSILNFTNRLLKFDLCPNVFKFVSERLVYNDMTQVPIGLSHFKMRVRRILGSTKEYIIYMEDDILLQKHKRFYPYNLEEVFNELPYNISLKICDHDFKYYLKSHFYARCPHAHNKKPQDCSECSGVLLIPDFIIDTDKCPLINSLTHIDFHTFNEHAVRAFMNSF